MDHHAHVEPYEEDDLADVELDPEDDPWYYEAENAQPTEDVSIPLSHSPETGPADTTAEVIVAQDNAIKALPLDEEAQKRLQNALNVSGLWPSCFRPGGPPANVPVDTLEKWSKADIRALLCIRRNCALLPKVFGPVLFPNRGKEAVPGKWKNMVTKPHPNWNRVNDEWLLNIFENNGEKFDEFAAYFEGQFQGYDLELAYAFAKNKKDNPGKGAKKRL